jgi:hypothetical protein
MAAPALADTVGAQIEKVRGSLEKYHVDTPTSYISSLIKNMQMETISNYLYRIPVETSLQGQYRKFISDGGTLGVGRGMKLTYLTAGYINSLMGFQITQEQIDTSKSRDQSVVNVFAETLARAMECVQLMDEIVLFTDGTGIVTNGLSATNGSTTATFAGATDTVGVNRLVEGMCVDVWTNNGITKRVPATAAPIVINSINYETSTVTFDQTVTAISAAASGDLLALRDMDVYGPAALTSFSSTWPQRGQVGGLGGDSFRHGIYYAHNVTTSNYYLGVQRSALPQLISARVNAASGGLTFNMGLTLLDSILQRRNSSSVNGLVGIWHMAQRRACFNLGVAISTKFISGDKFGSSVDLMPSNKGYDDVVPYCDVPMHLSRRQDRARIDFINPSNWGRAQLYDTQFYEVDGRRIFEGRSSTDGTVMAFINFYIKQSFDYFCLNPGAEGYIDALAVPA